MRTRAKQKFAAKATAPGARVPQAELFVIHWNLINTQVIILFLSYFFCYNKDVN